MDTSYQNDDIDRTHDDESDELIHQIFTLLRRVRASGTTLNGRPKLFFPYAGTAWKDYRHAIFVGGREGIFYVKTHRSNGVTVSANRSAKQLSWKRRQSRGVT